MMRQDTSATTLAKQTIPPSATNIPAPNDRTGWDEAMPTFQQAKLAADTATARQCEAEQVLLAIPAPDGKAVMWKVDSLYTPGDSMWGEGVEDQAHADLRRLLLDGRA